MEYITGFIIFKHEKNRNCRLSFFDGQIKNYLNTMKVILKKLIIATLSLFVALSITVVVTGNNLFKNNWKEILICYVAYIIIYSGILLLNERFKTKK